MRSLWPGAWRLDLLHKAHYCFLLRSSLLMYGWLLWDEKIIELRTVCRELSIIRRRLRDSQRNEGRKERQWLNGRRWQRLVVLPQRVVTSDVSLTFWPHLLLDHSHSGVQPFHSKAILVAKTTEKEGVTLLFSSSPCLPPNILERGGPLVKCPAPYKP